jgi:CubicO group peptidase (beta-lactamase class C family)
MTIEEESSTLAERWAMVHRILEEGLQQGVYIAAGALVGLKGELEWEGYVGRLSREPESPQVTAETVFDLASLTKPLATALALMRLVDRGQIGLNAALGDVLPEEWLPPDKRPLNIWSLLAHQAGLPAWAPFYQEVLAAPSSERATLLERLAAATPLEYAPSLGPYDLSNDTASPPECPFKKGGLAEVSDANKGTEENLPPSANGPGGIFSEGGDLPLKGREVSASVTLYSDLGYMLLKAVVEQAGGHDLDCFCRQEIYRPLGLVHMGFNPRRQPGGESLDFAATEPGLIPGRNIYGEVHDENAWAAGGVAGHAGLFGPGREVFRLLAALYRAYQGEAAGPLPPDLVRLFLTPTPGSTRTLGFDTPAAEASQCSAGRHFSPQSVGHLGFTGTSCWLDLKLGQVVLLFTNRVHLGRDNDKIRAFRPRLHEAASRALGFSRAFRT